MTTPGPPAVGTALTLLAASQPDMVRASQKDDSYIEQYIEATREGLRRLLGPFRALQYARESKLLALLLYHGLTTGLGQATLGEEYCGMQQVAGDCRTPGAPRRLLLALLLSAGPYAADRFVGQLDSAAEEAAGAAEAAVAATAAEDVAVAVADAESDTEYRDARQAGEGSAEARRRASGREAIGGPGSEAEAEAEAGSRRGGGGAEGGRRAWIRLLLAAVATRWARCWRALALAWPRARPLLSYAGRLHLALFYMYGTYYSLPHRLAGVRYSLSLRSLQGRPSYRVLGLLLGLQLAVMAALRARAVLRRMRTAGALAKRGRGGAAEAAASDVERYADEDEPAVMLDDLPYDDGEEEVEAEGSGSTDAGGSAGGSGGKGGGTDAGDSGWGKESWMSAAGGGGGGGSGGAAVEGWEEVQRHDYGGGSQWEADVFGLKQRAQPQQQPQQTQQQPDREVPGAGQGAGAATAPAAYRGTRRHAGSGGGRGGGGGGGGVLPVLTSLRQCPLCLSPKSHPTSTPCGHTFCWGCITTWCVEKPECPLCRAAVKPPQLVALYHTNC